MIEFENVGLRYGIHPEILSDLNFTLHQGSFHYLTGASGAGKTSMIRLLGLMQKPTRGAIRMFDTHTSLSAVSREDLVPVRRKIGIVYQDYRLLNHMSVFENVALPLRLRGTDAKSINANVEELLHWVGLGDRMDFYPLTLSGGEQQRVSIARAVISQPHLLLADEPTGNLDDHISSRLLKLFEQLHRMGTTIVMATHNLAIIDEFPHPQLHLENGTIHLKRARSGGSGRAGIALP